MMLRDLRKMLLEQHAEIRRHIAALEAALAQGLDVAEVRKRLEALKVLVESHNKVEEITLRPILETIDAWGPQRAEALAGQHRLEHEEVLEQLAPSKAGDAEHLRRTLAALAAHMAHEEKSLITEKLLRDDVIQLDAGD